MTITTTGHWTIVVPTPSDRHADFGAAGDIASYAYRRCAPDDKTNGDSEIRLLADMLEALAGLVTGGDVGGEALANLVAVGIVVFEPEPAPA